MGNQKPDTHDESIVGFLHRNRYGVSMENQGEQWRDRLEAQGWKAESLILLARLWRRWWTMQPAEGWPRGRTDAHGADHTD